MERMSILHSRGGHLKLGWYQENPIPSHLLLGVRGKFSKNEALKCMSSTY